jgi:hypothetical protein
MDTATPHESFRHHLAKSRRAFSRRNRRLIDTLGRAVEETREATRSYADFLAREGASWRVLALERGQSLSSSELSRGLLLQMQRALGLLQTRIDSRLAAMDTLALAEAPAADAPFEGYADMSARSLVSEIAQLDVEKCRAIEHYERANKNRATVLRAVRQRLAA